MENLTDTVRQRYADAARRVTAGGGATCGCGPASLESTSSSASAACCDPITSNLYDETQAASLPELALKASLGCGNPTALADLHAGEEVLDL
ncbi:MAG: arsenite S-adenosylmethyltransferase, partial [Acidobacteria bacterium]|nr:arsenite S-adenosylmethyltransferase [Acidobacteriota bacterium]